MCSLPANHVIRFIQVSLKYSSHSVHSISIKDIIVCFVKAALLCNLANVKGVWLPAVFVF